MKRQVPPSANPAPKTAHRTPVAAVGSSGLSRPTKETALTAQEEVLKQKERELVQSKAEIERRTAEITQRETVLATQAQEVLRQETVLKQREDHVAQREDRVAQREVKVSESELAFRRKAEEMTKREIEVVRREAELAQKTAELHQQMEQFRQRQALYEETQRECDERAGEITVAVETLNARAVELEKQAEALTEREGQLTAREKQLTARVPQTPRRPLYSLTRAPAVVAVPPERVSSPKSWVDEHSLLVRDQRETHYSYDETQQKEVDRKMSKIAYLNRVIEVMPVDTALENQKVMFGAILENRNSEQDSLLRTKLKIALEIIDFISGTDLYEPKTVKTGILGMFSKVEKSPTPLELELFRQFKEGVLRAKSLNDLDMAFSFVKTHGSAALPSSPAYERCVTQCEGMISEVQSRCVVGPHGF